MNPVRATKFRKFFPKTSIQIEDSMKHLLTLNKAIDPNIEREMTILRKKKDKTMADIVLLCLLRFKLIKAVMNRIPPSHDAWLEIQLRMVKRKLGPLKYLSDRAIKKIIEHVRAMNAARYSREPAPPDPDLPTCYYWNVEQVGHWLTAIESPHLVDMFARNGVSGRKLITLDASALSKMGLKYFEEIQHIASKIRHILKIHRPNMMRAMMRKVPFEDFLKQRQKNGRDYDKVTFAKFCRKNGYPYHSLKENPLALIECTCDLIIYMSAFHEITDNETNLESSEQNSLQVAPTVEFNIRHILIRDKVVSRILDELIHTAIKFSEKTQEKPSLYSILEDGFEELGLCSDEVLQRCEFGRMVAEEVLAEAKRTRDVISDIGKFRHFLKDENISEETVEKMREAASEFFDVAANVGSLLALGELDLENIFRQEPEFNNFVDGIIDEAESRLNEMNLTDE